MSEKKTDAEPVKVQDEAEAPRTFAVAAADALDKAVMFWDLKDAREAGRCVQNNAPGGDYYVISYRSPKLHVAVEQVEKRTVTEVKPEAQE